MADQYQPINVNTGSAQSAIQGTQNVTPNLEGLMQGIQSGFISADDIRKRVANGPLEAATRASDLADVQQIRPLQREAATAQLQNVQAKEKFEAESLPILNDIKREQLKNEYQNVLQHGVPDAVLKAFNSTVPGFIPYDNAKLFPKTGGVDTAYALELMGKAFEKAEKLKLQAKFTGPVKQTVTGPKGEVAETTTIMNQLTGQPVGVPIATDTKAANTAEAAKVQNQTAEGFRKEFYQADTVQALNKVDAAVNKIRLSATTDSTPFQDMSSIFGFMKVLDPGSTVREGEYATVEKSRGWPEAFRAYYNKAREGIKLTPEQKTQLLASAEQNYQGQLATAAPSIRQFLELESKNGFTPGTIVPVEFAVKLQTASPAPPPAPAAPGAPAVSPVANAPTVQTPAEASGLPAHIQFFKTPTGQLKVNPNYRP